jgi:hypothetical protein
MDCEHIPHLKQNKEHSKSLGGTKKSLDKFTETRSNTCYHF